MSAEPLRQRIAIPAYWTPATPDGGAMFGRLAHSAPATGIVVVNGSHSAPELPYHPAWGEVFRSLHAAGARALAYVDTGYLGLGLGSPSRPTRRDGPGRGRSDVDAWTAQITRDIDGWYRAYGTAGLQGIFLDRTTAACGPGDAHVARYRRIAAYIRDRYPGAYLVMNPGRTTERCYQDLADTLVTFEGTYDEYARWQPAGWEAGLPAERFWHLVYAAPDRAGMRRAVAWSKRRNAGYVHVTERLDTVDGLGHPWITMPVEDDWRAELVAAYGHEPSPSENVVSVP
ncbi:spherulation-specific family 4 protein [Micromonospora sp. CPCC 205711]|uniref:spherulation-specific family 4 protein n=1 Tax=Micromonospora sp. CPCC 205547 TaxID=3122400 RepID=UPI002FF28C33